MNDRDATPDWQRRLKRKLGENPARFLDHDLVERGSRHTDRTLQPLVRARIRGIDKIGVVNAWIAVERKLDRGPRDRIIELLEERKAYLEEYGERPDLATARLDERPSRYQPHSRDLPATEVTYVTADGERVPADKRPTKPTVGRRFDSATTQTEVVADGGEGQ
ncbi:hypothetical protein [Halorussus marinus]|uniref:hypothetical protein n=1 Tax=Halorussus marinus TaxID=2505976 RepID=UPI0010923F96|nr:hypothetical protein [Halorussus marinus]